jgi:predicted transcriptional regulator
MERAASAKPSQDELLRMTADIVSAYVSHNELPGTQIPDVIRSVFSTLHSQASGEGTGAQEPPKPVVSIRKSVTPDFIICLEDGRKLKMLKRHLRTTYSMTPEEYRAKWGLPADYPMVAPNYAAQRSAFAKKIGLGRKRAGAKRTRKAKK